MDFLKFLFTRANHLMTTQTKKVQENGTFFCIYAKKAVPLRVN